MIVLPAVDLRDGACVQLVGGSYDAERVRIPDPARVAREWRERGFSELHVVDLDAATNRGDNRSAIAAILEGAPEGSVQVGGGMRSAEAIDAVLALGARRIVVGTRAIEDPEWLAERAAARPDRIVVAADVNGREIVTRGWQVGSGRPIDRYLETLETIPVAGVLVTAVHVEGRMEGPDLALIEELVARTRHPVYASGGITSVADLHALARLGVAKAVIGMAFYTGLLDAETVAKEFGR